MRRQWYKFHYMMDRYFRPVTKWLLIVNVAIFLVRFLLLVIVDLIFKTQAAALSYMWLLHVPELVIQKYQAWRLVTYAFIHISGIHLIFNMLILFFFGSMVEDYMGSRRFLRFYFVVIVGAALIHTAFQYAMGESGGGLLGSSGGMFGILVAAAVMAPNQTVMWNFLFPIKMKYMVMIIILLEFVMLAGSGIGGPSNVSHITHLSGAVVAYVWLKGPDWWDGIRRWWDGIRRWWERRRGQGPKQVYRRFDGLW